MASKRVERVEKGPAILSTPPVYVVPSEVPHNDILIRIFLRCFSSPSGNYTACSSGGKETVGLVNVTIRLCSNATKTHIMGNSPILQGGNLIV